VTNAQGPRKNFARPASEGGYAPYLGCVRKSNRVDQPSLKELAMKSKSILFAAVIAAVAPFAAQAETPFALQFDDGPSTRSRAEVRAELAAVRGARANDIDPFGAPAAAPARSTAEVRAEARLARRIAGDILVADMQ
jgi:hypothetical protein